MNNQIEIKNSDFEFLNSDKLEWLTRVDFDKALKGIAVAKRSKTVPGGVYEVPESTYEQLTEAEHIIENLKHMIWRAGIDMSEIDTNQTIQLSLLKGELS